MIIDISSTDIILWRKLTIKFMEIDTRCPTLMVMCLLKFTDKIKYNCRNLNDIAAKCLVEYPDNFFTSFHNKLKNLI